MNEKVTPFKEGFARNLHRAVCNKGIKQVELANALHLPPTTVNGWFRGAHYPDLEQLLELCNYLKVSVGELLGEPQCIEKDVSQRGAFIVSDPYLETCNVLDLDMVKKCGAKRVVIEF